MGEADNCGPLLLYVCLLSLLLPPMDEVEDEEEEEEEQEELPLQWQCEKGYVGGYSSCGSVYLPYLAKREREIGYDVNAANRLLGMEPFTAAAIADIENDCMVDTDDDLLNWEPTHWRVFDDPNRLELYHIIVYTEDACAESECLEMLRQIGCEKRFSCCSIEIPRVFFAWLKQEEAEKLRGVKGVADLIMRRKMFVHC